MLAGIGDSPDLRDWIDCLILPMAEHLAVLGSPTWYARFNEQVVTDPSLRRIVTEESQSSPSMVRIVDGLLRRLPDLPAAVVAERGEMTRMLLLHMMAQRERALADRTPTPRSSWHEAATGLIDALIGLWQAPATTHPQERNERT